MNLPNPNVSEMKLLREQGVPLSEIGRRFGVSKERVRQLIGNTGRTSTYYRVAHEKRQRRKAEIKAKLQARFNRFNNERNGKLVVLKRNGNELTCRCDCGAIHVLTCGNFNKTKSCGCLASENGASQLEAYRAKQHRLKLEKSA